MVQIQWKWETMVHVLGQKISWRRKKVKRKIISFLLYAFCKVLCKLENTMWFILFSPAEKRQKKHGTSSRELHQTTNHQAQCLQHILLECAGMGWGDRPRYQETKILVLDLLLLVTLPETPQNLPPQLPHLKMRLHTLFSCSFKGLDEDYKWLGGQQVSELETGGHFLLGLMLHDHFQVNEKTPL